MKDKFTQIIFLAVFITMFLAFNINAQDFTRATPIDVPETTLNNGGAGNMIAGVDVDGDGKTEIYWVNNNWNDGATEIIPRIYKLENDGGTWSVVWSAVAPVVYQNTWPTLALTDLDKDGKPELLWGIVNAGSANPYRIVAYEYAGDGSDVFGIATADTNAGSGEELKYAPNAASTIVDADGINMRIMDWQIVDIDGDGTNEICFADRKGYYHFGILTVDNIPDNGDGSETWTVESSGLDFTLDSNIQNKWDVAVIGNNFYSFDEEGISKVSWDGSAYQYKELMPMAGGSSNQSAISVDIDKDETEEILCAVYDWADDTQKGVMLLQEDADSLKHTMLFNISKYWTSRGAWGADAGDIDGDGNLDYIFGSRGGTVEGRIFRVAYTGGNILDSTSYDFSVIDSNYSTDGIWSIIKIANIDDDPENEVLYTSSIPVGGLFGGTAPIIVLDYNATAIGGEFDKYPLGFQLKQNYPNPFNPSTTISFNLPAAANTALVIYDITGQKVRTLVNNPLSSGEHSVTWDGLSDAGHEVASGTYFYKLTSKNISITKKMQLQR